MQQPIGFFDSGLGGLSVLASTIKLLPFENYLYFGDSLHNPYGDKSGEDIIQCAITSIQRLVDAGCKLIVIACNTVSTIAADSLKEKFPDIIFIFTVPAIKVIFDENKEDDTLVMVTKGTLHSKRMEDFRNTYKERFSKLTFLACSGLADLVEEGSSFDIHSYLARVLDPYLSIKTVVLGCTHYSLIKKELQEILPHAEIIDGNMGIANEVKRQLVFHHLLNTKQEKGYVKIENSISSKIEKI